MLLRSVLRLHPRLRPCLTRCRHCRIFFFTDPRNAWRRDLGCPFGCREAHRRRQSSERSTAYYRDEVGKLKKRLLNARRRPPAVVTTPVLVAQPRPWPRAILLYVRLLVRLIDGRSLTLTDVSALLGKAVRQHTMARTRRRDQFVAWLHAKPP